MYPCSWVILISILGFASGLWRNGVALEPNRNRRFLNGWFECGSKKKPIKPNRFGTVRFGSVPIFFWGGTENSQVGDHLVSETTYLGEDCQLCMP